jgi:predicted Zn-dependent protease with MMP-like domain
VDARLGLPDPPRPSRLQTETALLHVPRAGTLRLLPHGCDGGRAGEHGGPPRADQGEEDKEGRAGRVGQGLETEERCSEAAHEQAGSGEAEETRAAAAEARKAHQVTRAQFERQVAEALTTIPKRFRDAMQNIAIVVEEEPDPELLDELEAGPDDTLFGLYTGTPLTERNWGHGNALPDRIILFQGPHEREAEDDDDLIASIGETLIHEIGHYFGLSEEEIEHIENEYWRGDARAD